MTTKEETQALVERLREAGAGTVEWRICDKAGHCALTSGAESDAREFLANRLKRWPNQGWEAYDVVRAVVQDDLQELSLEAADAITHLQQQLGE